MLRMGIISELGEGENVGFARVYFEEMEMVSHWLPLPSYNTKSVKHWIPIEVNSQVACLMDARCEQGTIVAVLWSDTDNPPAWASANTLGILFADGAEFYYDWDSHTFTANAPNSELNFKCKALNVEGAVNITGDTSVKGEITATKDITADGEVTAGLTKTTLTGHQHTTGVGPSGPPIPNT